MLVVIHPGARKSVRQWPEERYAEVGRYLITEYGAKIILTGSRDEVPLIKGIKTLMNNEAAVIGATELNSLKQLTALFERCRLYIGVSSGASHLAGTAHLPSVLLFALNLFLSGIPWEINTSSLKRFPLLSLQPKKVSCK